MPHARVPHGRLLPVGAAVLVLLLPVFAAQVVQNDAAQLPGARMAAAVVWDGRDRPDSGCPKGCAYVFGGQDNQGRRGEIFRYNPNLNQVVDMQVHLFEDRSLFQGATVGDNVYLFGGFGSSGAVNQILRYEISANTLWSVGASLPEPRHGVAAASNGVDPYFFGGETSGAQADLFRYVVATSTLVRTSGMPDARSGASAVYDGQAFYILGGRDGGVHRDTILRYQPSTNAWSTMAARMPAGRADGAATFDGRYIHYFGGHDGARKYDQILRYDPTADAIATLTPRMAAGTDYLGAVYDGTASYLVGGRQDAQIVDDVHRFFSGSAAQTTPRSTPTSGTSESVPSTRPTSGGGSPQGVPVGVWIGLAGAVAAVPVGFIVLRAVRRPARAASRATAVAAPAASGVALALREVSVSIRGKAIVHPVSFEAPQASLTFLLGTSGSGKSTLLKAIVGLQSSTGVLQIAGETVKPGSSSAQRRLGYVPQDLQLYPNLGALANIRYFASQYGIPAGEADKRGRALLEQLGLQGFEDRTLNRLSGGQARRVSIACALVHEPALIVLDEPTSGLDFTSRKALWGVLQRLVRERGVAVLATTHFLDDAQYGDRVGIMYKGRLAALGSVRSLVRSLPGGGRCVEVEFEDLTPADKARLQTLLPTLREKGISRVDVHTFTARFFARDPSTTARTLPEELYRQRFRVRSTRLDDVNLEDVFQHYTGEAFQPEPT